MQISLSLEDADGLNLSGVQRVSIQASPAPLRVDLTLDGVKLTSLYGAAMTQYDLDTTKISDGSHRLLATGVYKTRNSTAQMAFTSRNQLPAGSFGAGVFGQGPFGG